MHFVANACGATGSALLSSILAEAVRFELTGPCGPPVFEFSAVYQFNNLGHFRLRNLLKRAAGACPIDRDSGWPLRRSFRGLGADSA